VLDGLTLAEPKTRVFVGAMKKLGVKAPALVITDDRSPSLVLSVRNVQKMELTTAAQVGVYEIVRYPTIVVTRSAMEKLQARMTGDSASATEAQGQAENAG
jgi:large subunit ribosomal protein L4